MNEDKYELRQVVRAAIYAPEGNVTDEHLERDLYRFSVRLTGLSVKESHRDIFVRAVLDAIAAICRLNGYSPSSVSTDPSADQDIVHVNICGVPAGTIHFITTRREDPFRAIRHFLQEGGAS